MTASEMNREIRIQARVLTKDSAGQDVESWIEWKQVFAKVRQRVGRERYEGRQDVAYRDDRFYIYYIVELNHPDAAANYRIIYDLQIYDIESIVQVGLNDKQEIVAKFKDNV